MDPVVVAIVGDTHTNSTIGVNPPDVPLDEGGSWTANETNLWRWQCWNDYWDEVEMAARKADARLYVVINGDAIEDPYHPTSEIISVNKNSALRSALRVLDRPRRMAHHFFVVRGTIAHTGIGAWMEEAIANMLEAEPDEEMNTSSWYHLPLMAGDLLFDIAHHPKTVGRLPWTESAAPARQGVYTLVKNHRAGRRIPDVVVRSHHHGEFLDSGLSTEPRVFYLRPWQMSTQYSHRIGESGIVNPIGGAIFTVYGSDLVPKDVKFLPREREPWKPE